MPKVKIIRGVYVKGVPHPEGAIVEVTGAEASELIWTNYAEEIIEPPKAEPAHLSAANKQVVQDEADATKRNKGA